MTRQDQQVAVEAIVEDRAWLEKLRTELRGLLAPVFAQARSRWCAFAYVDALLAGPGDRRSCWQLAERAGHASPRRMQALLAEHRWDWRAALAALQRFVAAHLGDPDAIVAIDETAELKKGTATVGVARQHAGITGQVENCQTIVMAGDVAFATKPDLAGDILASAVSAGVPFGWVAADEVYGRASRLRSACEQAGKGYVLAVPVSFTVTLPSGRRAAMASVARLIPARCWETRSCGTGCKGHRDYQRAWAATSSARHHVLIRRSTADPSGLAFVYCHVPAGRPASLPVLIRVAGKRWPAEECHQQGKGQAGLDQHQVRLWHSFCRHTVLSMCALALLAAAAARPRGTEGTTPGGQPHAWRDTGVLPRSPSERPPADPGLVKVSVPEARRLLQLAATPGTRPARDPGYAWSRWRRRHQARARYHHYQTRLRAARAT